MIKCFHILLILACCITIAACATLKEVNHKQATFIALGHVATKPGIYQPHDGRYQAELRSATMGGFIILYIREIEENIAQEVNDITGIAWINNSILVYTVSPLYGNPGVYIFDSSSKKIKIIVAPKKVNAAFPNGTDYFELHHLSSNKIYFYYALDVDLIDFKEFRSPQFLFSANFDGGEFQKVTSND